jgi:hypothetical protein
MVARTKRKAQLAFASARAAERKAEKARATAAFAATDAAGAAARAAAAAAGQDWAAVQAAGVFAPAHADDRRRKAAVRAAFRLSSQDLDEVAPVPIVTPYGKRAYDYYSVREVQGVAAGKWGGPAGFAAELRRANLAVVRAAARADAKLAAAAAAYAAAAAMP